MDDSLSVDFAALMCTPHARAAFAAAEAERVGNNYVGPEHLFLAVLALLECGAANVLVRLGLSVETVRH